jgi:hypothetical protein
VPHRSRGQPANRHLDQSGACSSSPLLQNGSSLTGAIDSANTAKSVVLTLDSTSTWTVTADFYLTGLSGAAISGSTITNVVGNGHTVYYDATASANTGLGGQTYTLSGWGTLTPAWPHDVLPSIAWPRLAGRGHAILGPVPRRAFRQSPGLHNRPRSRAAPARSPPRPTKAKLTSVTSCLTIRFSGRLAKTEFRSPELSAG